MKDSNKIEIAIATNVFYEVQALIVDYELFKEDDAQAIIDHIINIAQLGYTDAELCIYYLVNANIITATTGAACQDLIDYYDRNNHRAIPYLLQPQAM